MIALPSQHARTQPAAPGYIDSAGSAVVDVLLSQQRAQRVADAFGAVTTSAGAPSRSSSPSATPHSAPAPARRNDRAVGAGLLGSLVYTGAYWLKMAPNSPSASPLIPSLK